MVYWLIPTKAKSELFRDIIGILAKQFDAPSFAPHLTLCRTEEVKSVGKMLSHAPIRLRIRGIAHSPKFTKALFVRFTPTKSLKGLVTELGGKPNSLTDPHLSLLYAALPAAIRRELVATVKLPFGKVAFDAVMAMSCISPTENKQDVKSWRKLETKLLERGRTLGSTGC